MRNISNLKVLIFTVFLVFILLLCPNKTNARHYSPPVRVIARADVLRLSYSRYSIVEFLDVYNDDFVNPLVIEAITADSWHIHRKFISDEDWLEDRGPIIIQPGKSFRVAERKRVVAGGSQNHNWWYKWTRFKVKTTNWGDIYSNMVSSPFQPDEIVEILIKEDLVDPTTQPQYLSPQQRKENNHYR